MAKQTGHIVVVESMRGKHQQRHNLDIAKRFSVQTRLAILQPNLEYLVACGFISKTV